MIRSFFYILTSISIYCVLSLGCSPTEFQGGGEIQDPGPDDLDVTTPKIDYSVPGQAKITAGCKNKTATVKGSSGIKAVVQGELCVSPEDNKKSSGTAHIVFIVDKSNSMATADPSCKRKEAISTVISKTISKNPDSDIKGALVMFGTQAQSSGWKKLSLLGYDDVCNLPSKDEEGGTNYEAAFDVAGSLLGSKSGKNIIYFLTDGAPSASNSMVSSILAKEVGSDFTKGASSGRTAMKKLKKTVVNLTVNAVFLKDPDLDNPKSQVRISYPDAPNTQQTKEYLEEIIGNSNRVKVADDADDLVKVISDFNTDTSSSYPTISSDNVSGSVVTDGKKSSVKVEDFELSSEGIYSYTLAKKALQGTKGQDSNYTFTVKGKASNGKTASSMLEVKFVAE